MKVWDLVKNGDLAVKDALYHLRADKTSNRNNTIDIDTGKISTVMMWKDFKVKEFKVNGSDVLIELENK